MPTRGIRFVRRDGQALLEGQAEFNWLFARWEELESKLIEEQPAWFGQQPLSGNRASGSRAFERHQK